MLVVCIEDVNFKARNKHPNQKNFVFKKGEIYFLDTISIIPKQVFKYEIYYNRTIQFNIAASFLEKFFDIYKEED